MKEGRIMTRVGIPHGLFYYYYFPLWKTLFTDLGADVIVSGPTNRVIIDDGVQLAVDEACFPVKVFFGHVRMLIRQNIDYIFLPRFISVEPKSYICPKFMGIPDMVRALVPNLTPVIDITVDLSKSNRQFKRDLIKLGQIFKVNSGQVLKAYRHGLQELYFCNMIAREGFTPAEAVQIWEGDVLEHSTGCDLNLGILGHGYSLYDSEVSLNIIKRLQELGCRVVLPEMLDPAEIETEAATIPKRVFWTLGRKMVGSALAMEKSRRIDGIIYIACFGCGPDSLIGEIIQHQVKNTPFMLITIDEHTGEAGLVTRLEAFCDMLRRCGSAPVTEIKQKEVIL